MPIYIYEHPKTKKIKEVIQTMSEPHVYAENGVEWNRVWTIPQAAVDANIDPFNERQYMDKTGANKGTMGDAWDRSEELSHKRAEKAGGKDPVREKYFENYSKKRKGTKHPKQIQEAANKEYII